MPFKYDSLRARLNANSKPMLLIDNLGPCRIWIGSTGGSLGYGKITMRVRGKPKRFYAHRVSLAESMGLKLCQLRAKSLHFCNNPPCIEPAHLRGGTQKQNVQQCVLDGRHRNGATS